MNTGQHNYDVLIIGAGVAGLTQALALAQAGFRVAVIDQGQAPAPWLAEEPWDSRVFAFTRASQQLLTSLGLWEALKARRFAPYSQMALGWSGYPERAVRLRAGDAAEPDLGHIIEQRVLRETLWQQAESQCHFYWGSTWQDLCLTDQASSLVLTSGLRLNAALIIAADGASSKVREHLGIAVVSWSYQADAVVATIRSALPHQDTARQIFTEEGTVALLPLADPHVCSLVWSTPRADALLRLSEAAFCRSLNVPFDQQLGVLTTLTTPVRFPLHASYNHVFAQSGLAFIADAAHVVHPLAGQGLNLGLADVACLTATLIKARTLQRPIGHLAVLTPYARARKVAAKDMVLLMTGLEKAGRFSAKYPNFISKIMMAALSHNPLLKKMTTTFALHSLNK